jgi:hypothetical protein
MDRFTRLSTQLAGAALILGPALIVCAALLAAAGVGTTTGRWYDNRLEGVLMIAGFSLQLIGLLELGRRIGASRPVLGAIVTLTSVLGAAGAILPSMVRVLSSAELASGITVEQLDRLHGAGDDGADPLLIVIPFILCFFLTYFLLAFGLWRTRLAPPYASILLAVGVILFVFGQSSFVVNFPAYIAAVTVWLLTLAPLGLRLLRIPVAAPGLVGEGAPAD